MRWEAKRVALKQYVQCDSCGRIWEVSALADVRRGYVCPDCEDRMMMRPRRSAAGVWTSDK